MANTIVGKVLSIGKKVNVSKTNEFLKREIVLDCSRYDRYTGEKRENYAKFSFTQKNCEKLDGFKVGDLVEVSFVLNGRKWDKEGTVVYIMDIEGYDIAAKGAKNASQGDNNAEDVQVPAPEGENASQANIEGEGDGKLPF